MGRSTHYSTLGVEPEATQAQIKRAYRDLAKSLHPDVSKAADAAKRFARIAAAYEILGDAVKRRTYDQSLREPKSRPSSQTTAEDLRAHYTWTNITAHGAAEAAKANNKAEIDELYDTFFGSVPKQASKQPKNQPPLRGKKARRTALRELTFDPSGTKVAGTIPAQRPTGTTGANRNPDC